VCACVWNSRFSGVFANARLLNCDWCLLFCVLCVRECACLCAFVRLCSPRNTTSHLDVMSWRLTEALLFCLLISRRSSNTHTHTQAQARTSVHTHTHTQARTHSHENSPTHPRARTKYTCTQTHTQTHSHCTRTHTHTKHTHTHAHTHPGIDERRCKPTHPLHALNKKHKRT